MPATASPVRRVPVDAVALEARAAALGSRSVKSTAKAAMLARISSCCDLTSLEGSDTPGRIRSLCARAVRPETKIGGLPHVAAVCVYPSLVPDAVAAVAGSAVKVASVAGGFPSGLLPLDLRLAEIRWAVGAGADEIDIVMNRSAYLTGDYATIVAEVEAAKDACADKTLKVILETGELGSYDAIRHASDLAIAGGADFVKTSTGKIPAGATFPVALCLAESVRDAERRTGRRVGLKFSGGVRSAKEAWTYLVVVQETLGPDWLSPELLRLGASGLLDDVAMQWAKLHTGRYERPENVPVI